MNIHNKSDVIEKLAHISDLTGYEPAGDSPHTEKQSSKKAPSDAKKPRSIRDCITHVTTPTGKMPVLKTMVTTACERNCYYCPFRAGRGTMRRESFSPDVLARTFDDMQRAKLVEGMFLSSGIVDGGVTTQDKVIDTVEIVRKKYQYRGYIHLKIMPGAELDQIHRAMQLADRISINLEGPTQERLNALAPKKEFTAELLDRLIWAGDLRRDLGQRTSQKLASLVTQFVVGAVGDTDLELLSISEKLYQQVGLKRAYYAGFNPIEDTPFEDREPTPALREFRLYQSSYLLRDYQWNVEDLPFEGEGNLRLDVDPKRAWADANLRHAPVEVMCADRRALLRIPGIGPIGANAILKARRKGNLRELTHLRAIGIRAPEKSAPYILLDGRRPPHQLELFS